MDLWTKVRHYIFTEGHTPSEACREFDLNYRSVKKMMEYSEPPGYRRTAPRKEKIITPFLPVIDEILTSDRQAPSKQKHTAQRIFDRLRDEYDYTGGYTSVKDAVREWKQTNKEVFVSLAHPPGEAQVDYGFAKVYMAGELEKVALFVMSLPYSDALFVRAYPRECTETFQDGHVQAFRFFGGVTKRNTYDNSKIAVAQITGSRDRKLTDEFLRLESHYLFESHFCLVRRPTEKGHTECLVGFARRNYLVPVPRFNTFAELNAHLEECCRKDLARQLRGKDGTKQERLKEEQSYLRALPNEAFEPRKMEARRSSALSLVRFDNNDYSVPTQHAHKHLSVIATVDEVRIMDKDELIAVHKRDWGKAQAHFNPVHYLRLLEKKPGAFDVAKPLQGWELPKCFDLLRRRLESDKGKEGLKEYIRILRLLESYPLKTLAKAVHKALKIGMIDFCSVRIILEGCKEKPIKLFQLDGHPHLENVHVQTPDLQAYAILTIGGEQ